MLDAVQTCTLQNTLACQPQLNVEIATAEALDPPLPLGATAALCEDGACCRPAR